MTIDPTQAPAATPARRRTRWYGPILDAVSPVQAGLVLAAAALLIVGLLGGLGAAVDEADTLPTTDVGTATVATPLEITARRARHFEELPPAFVRQDGFLYIVVSLDVTNTTDRPVGAYLLSQGSTLDVAGLATIDLPSGRRNEYPAVIRTADSLSQRTFQPGLTTNVVLAWRQAKSEPLPAVVTLTLSEHTWRRSMLDGSLDWRDPKPVTHIALPLEALPQEP